VGGRSWSSPWSSPGGSSAPPRPEPPRAEFWSALAEDDGRRWTVEVDAHAAGHACVVRLSCAEAAAVIDALVGNVFAPRPRAAPTP
jgi:hypothetical protein